MPLEETPEQIETTKTFVEKRDELLRQVSELTKEFELKRSVVDNLNSEQSSVAEEISKLNIQKENLEDTFNKTRETLEERVVSLNIEIEKLIARKTEILKEVDLIKNLVESAKQFAKDANNTGEDTISVISFVQSEVTKIISTVRLETSNLSEEIKLTKAELENFKNNITALERQNELRRQELDKRQSLLDEREVALDNLNKK